MHNAAACITKAIKTISKRLKYMGRTPGKNSTTGKKVWDRMYDAGEARFGRKGNKEFWDPGNERWRDISEADMGHLEDAVKWWNRKGKKYGAKSKEVRDWMKDPDNYKLEYFRTNRSRGAIVGKTHKYELPLK